MKTFILILLLCILTTVSYGQEILNKDNVQVLESDKLVVIDFWAEWCKYCKLLDPVIERLIIFNQRYNKNKIEWYKVDVDKDRKFLNNFRPFRGLPVIAFYRNGKEIDRLIGFQSFLTIQNVINTLLKEERKEKKDNCKDGVCTPPKEVK